MTSKLMCCGVIGLLAACAQDAGPGDPPDGEAEDPDPIVDTAIVAGAPDACEPDDDGGETLAEQLARARAATEKYQDVEEAIADGFVPAEHCVAHPQLGVMGYHFVNPARLMDPLSIEEPEALLYVQPHAGHWQLVAIEYLQPIIVGGMPYMGCGVEDNTCPPANPPPNPSLFTGISFDGPMAGHEEGMPWHFDQHVWLYADNPSGLFAPFNPSLSCAMEPDC